MKIIVYKLNNNELRIFNPNPSSKKDDETENEWMQRLLQDNAIVPAIAIEAEIVEQSSLPSDRTFRNAWRMNSKSISTDMVHARNIHREKLRELRAQKFIALDEQYLRADESGDIEAKRLIANEKQALRNVTADPAIEAAQTAEELKAVMPDILK